MLLDVDATVAGIVVSAAGSLTFDPNARRTLTSRGNVVVSGRLVMRPAGPHIDHVLLFTGAVESAFRGGGTAPLSSDVGLWIIDHGILDAVGSEKRAWTRATATIRRGVTSVSLAQAPTGWRPGDEVAITPTGPPTTSNHYGAYDVATISSISGNTIRLSRSARFEHPLVRFGGRNFGAEVLNLTRNVRIEGTASRRTHVFIRSFRPQVVRGVAVRHVGPRQGAREVLGRYGFHFHMVEDASRGSLVEGVVVRDSGNHAFVPHHSNGVTFRDCIAHDVQEEAFWWDPGRGHGTSDVLYDRCVASLVDSAGEGFRLSGFWLGHGKGNRVRGCVAVGILGNKNAAGYVWPEAPGGGKGLEPGEQGDWTFQDSIAHNNRYNGIFVWQNSGGPLVDRFIAFHNGRAGIEHGAYRNDYGFEDSVMYGNRVAAVVLTAVAGRDNPSLRLTRVTCDGAGLSDFAVLLRDSHPLPAAKNTQIRGCTFRGYKRAGIGVLSGTRNPDVLDVVNCTFSGNEFWFEDNINAGTLVRVQDPAHGALALRRQDQSGEFRRAWNARVSQIARFA